MTEPCQRPRGLDRAKGCKTDGCEGRHYGKGKGLCKRCSNQAWRAANPEYIRVWRAANPEKQREYNRARSGFTSELEASFLAAQDHACAICRIRFGPLGRANNSANRDHCHICQQARGILCKPCNSILGHYKHQRRAGLRVEPYDSYLAKSCGCDLREQEAS